ncbi:Gamma-tubulin complex component 2 [Armadillidium nasatum]|uniref:Gamma-tubulin complex component n=1 Tax=Armadillidium nasatum TaxID=96803 RepID=A0A5N5TIT3_9CRUS|nr:Gamma-tubulin complex component 2 [Armadillidium nasatum]
MKMYEEGAEAINLSLPRSVSNPILSDNENFPTMKLSEKEIKELKSRIIKESQSDTLSNIVKEPNSIGPPIPDWLKAKQYLSLNFVLLNKPEENAGPLGELVVSAQEYYLIEDILLLMTGCQGTYITVQKSKNKDEFPTFVIDPSVEPSLKALVNRILPLCHYYSKVVEFIEMKSNYDEGTVNHALSAAIRNLLKDYLLLVTQLESQQIARTLTLHRLWFYIEKTIGLMELLACLSVSITKANCHGGAVLSLLYERNLSLTGCGQLQDILIYLMEAASVPYMKMLSLWIYRGVIIDYYKEFMVVDKEESHDSSKRNDSSTSSENSFFQYDSDYDEYWEKRYSLCTENVPTFLESHADIILRTGKYLNVIRESDPSVVCPEQEEIIYSVRNKNYIEIIEKTYGFASKRLLQLLLKEKDLLGHLRSMKHYFLLDKGDFVVQLLTLCESELIKNIDDVVPTRLESLLELALRTSSANSHTYKDNVHCILLPYSLMSQMLQILRVWLSNKIAKGFLLSSAATYKKAFTLRQRMIYFIQNLEYYMHFEVIERNWQYFLSKVQKSPEPESAIQPEASESFEQTVAKYDLQFTGMLVTLVDKISDMGRENYNDALIHVLYRLDFNNYYSNKSEIVQACSSPENSLDIIS